MTLLHADCDIHVRVCKFRRTRLATMTHNTGFHLRINLSSSNYTLHWIDCINLATSSDATEKSTKQPITIARLAHKSACIPCVGN